MAPPPPSLSAGGASGVVTPAAPSLRGVTVTMLAILWGLNAPLALSALAVSLFSLDGVLRIALAVTYLALVGISGVMAWGLWSVKPWARTAQLVLAGLGIIVPFSCPFVVSLISIIVYMLRPAVKARFAGTPEVEPKETMFAVLVGIGVFLGVLGLIGLSLASFFASAAQSIPVE
jgi:hypothetical protein